MYSFLFLGVFLCVWSQSQRLKRTTIWERHINPTANQLLLTIQTTQTSKAIRPSFARYQIMSRNCNFKENTYVYVYMSLILHILIRCTKSMSVFDKNQMVVSIHVYKVKKKNFIHIIFNIVSFKALSLKYFYYANVLSNH